MKKKVIKALTGQIFDYVELTNIEFIDENEKRIDIDHDVLSKHVNGETFRKMIFFENNNLVKSIKFTVFDPKISDNRSETIEIKKNNKLDKCIFNMTLKQYLDESLK